MLSATLAILLQVGPNPAVGGFEPIPYELEELRRLQKERSATVAPPQDRFAACLLRADQDAIAAKVEANDWLDTALGLARAHALHCRGIAQANRGQWSDAAASFEAAMAESAVLDPKYRARLGAMAGNVLLAADDAARALAVLDTARTDAAAADFPPLGAEIELDRARALLKPERAGDAVQALSHARELVPTHARAWLLSATLSRRTDRLEMAQTQIEQAGLLDPASPAIGLEAGLIAALSGNDDAARRSWQSVVALAPGTALARSAQSYLDQLRQP